MRRLRPVGGWLVVLGLLLGAVLLVGSGGTAAAQAAPGQVSGSDVSTGAQLFVQSCAACHGTQGQGTAAAPAIAGRGAADVDFVLRTGRMPLSDPRQQMVRNKPVFDDAQIRAIVAYVAGLGGGPAIPSPDVTRGDITRGRSLFIQNCAACHAATGAGDAVGGGFEAPGLSQADPLTVAEAMRVGPGAMPVFDPRLFPDQDVNDVAAYVQYLRRAPSPGGLAIADVGPVAEGFVAGIIGLGLLLLVVAWIGRPVRVQLPGRPGRRGRGDAP